MLLCHLCSQEGCTRQLGDLQFCNDCYNAVQAKRKALAEYPHARQAEDEEMRFEPDAWREKTIRWVGKTRKDARSQTRREAIEFEETSDIRRNSEKKGKIRLNKQRFGAFKMFWDGLTKEASDALFDELHSEQEGKWDDDEKIVRIDNVGVEDVVETAKETKKGVKRSADIDANQYITQKLHIIDAAHRPSGSAIPSSRTLSLKGKPDDESGSNASDHSHLLSAKALRRHNEHNPERQVVPRTRSPSPAKPAPKLKKEKENTEHVQWQQQTYLI